MVATGDFEKVGRVDIVESSGKINISISNDVSVLRINDSGNQDITMKINPNGIEANNEVRFHVTRRGGVCQCLSAKRQCYGGKEKSDDCFHVGEGLDSAKEIGLKQPKNLIIAPSGSCSFRKRITLIVIN